MAYLLKYYTFSAKIRTLTEFHVRISCSQQPPSNVEIIATLRYFHQTLIGFLKDVPSVHAEAFEKFNPELPRANLYPNLNYSGLFYGIVNLLDAFPMLQSGQSAIGEEILNTLKALYFFLEKDAVDQMPILIASQLGVFPAELDSQIVHLLADCLLPYLNGTGSDMFVIPVVLMLVLQHNPDPKLHTWILESLLCRNPDIYHHLITLIAKGSSESRVAAANLLFHYWPLMNPQIMHRKPIQYRVHAWSAPACENKACTEKHPSVKRCFDPLLCAKNGETAPPMNICKSCADDMASPQAMRNICQPMPATNSSGCQSSSRIAVGTCYAEDCIRSHQFTPLRLCQECFVCLHDNPVATKHIRHTGSGCVWDTNLERDMIEAVVMLLKETSFQLEGAEGEGKRPKWLRQLEGGQTFGKEIDIMHDERRMLSRFGVWMMVAVCPPSKEAPPEAIGYIMAMIFQWFATTALLPNDAMGASLEQLKTDFVSDWLNLAIANHYDVFVETLHPNPPEYAQVGGMWDKLSTKKEQMKEGLTKLLAIMPYDIITFETWNRVIPKWLKGISEQIEEDDLPELKIQLCKIFEADLCSLPFDTSKMFEFVKTRLAKGNFDDVADGLDWLHLLSRMEISIQLSTLLDMFNALLSRIGDLAIPDSDEIAEFDEGTGIMAIHVTVIDILSQQMKLNEIGMHEVSSLSEQLFASFSELLQYSSTKGYSAEHRCQNPEMDQFSDCPPCQQAAFFYQVLMQMTEVLCPRQQVTISVVENDDVEVPTEAVVTSETDTTPSYLSNVHSPQIQQSTTSMVPSPVKVELSPPEGPTKSLLQFHSASVQEEVEDLEFVGILPTEEIETAIAQAVTLTETDVGREHCHVVTSTLVENLKGTPVSPASQEPEKTEFWDTSVGRFRFSIAQLPAQLKFIRALLMNMDIEIDPDVQYFLLNTLKYLCLHCEALSNARREHRGFLIWTQENLLIPKLWAMLKSDYAQIGQLAVLLILHAITLPCGEEVFWNTVTAEFISGKWEVRFKAVERAYVLAHMIVTPAVKANKLIQTSLSSAFAHLIASIHDPNAAVAQRAMLALKSMPSTALNLMCLCLESQFDSCIMDRALIIHRIQLLTTVVPEESILTWDFFIQRFESMALESQLSSKSDKSGFVQDLLHSDPMSDLYQRKLNKARKALNDADTVRSIVKSLKGRCLKHQLTTAMRGGQPDSQELPPFSPTQSEDGYGRLREFTDEESNMCLLLNRVVDLENPERHSVYLTVSLFVSFLCNKKLSAQDEKMNAKKQSVLLRHFNTLLGYSNSEKCFTIPPHRLRKSAVCNAFLTGLPEILDSNLLIGNQMLPTIAQLLLHLPSPQKLASDHSIANYSLYLLDIPSRHSWLNTIILILYKYRFDSAPISDVIMKLMLIVIASLESHVHSCKPAPTSTAASPVAPPTIEIPEWSDDTSGSEKEEEVIKEEEDHDHEEELKVSEIQAPQLVRPESLKVMEVPPVKLMTLEEHRAVSMEVKVQPVCRIVEPSEHPPDPHPSYMRPFKSHSFKETVRHSVKDKKGKRRMSKKLKMKRMIPKKSPVVAGVKDGVKLRCAFCHEPLETFDEESLSLCLIAVETFLHRDPAMGAPLLFRILRTVTRFVDHPMYPWHDVNMFVTGNSRSVAKQLLRVVLHQLSASGIALQLFDSTVEKPTSFWNIISISLMDFQELNPVNLIQNLLNDMFEEWPSRMSRILHNLSAYIAHVPCDSYITSWSAVINSLEAFFRRYHTQVTTEHAQTSIKTELKCAISVMNVILKVQNFSTFKSATALVDAFSKWVNEAVHECKVELIDLLNICTACNRALIKERDKQCMTRSIISELVQALKFKCTMHESNYMTIVNLILQDAGETVSEDMADDQFNTAACEVVRPLLNEILDFIADLHVLSKLKKQINNDTLGGDLKAALAQVIAIEMSRTSARDCRAVARFIPWLMSPPNVTQAAANAFAESVTNVRILSWLLLGALHASPGCLPVPIECSNHMADYIHFVLAGFADQSKQSVVHMSALFHAFHLCQLWTVYCEQASGSSCESGQQQFSSILDFWARVTPAILQLLSHSKVLADMVNLHFVNTMQSLQQCNSAVLCQLYPMWQPILTAYHSQIPNQLRIKLDSTENQPAIQMQPLAQWLKKVRYKISQIELQTSAASPFYNV
ncbi:hypothetical protein QR680_011527 [Steinernema hermaphroditum]|uniref:Uncoordinated protein 79 n=1 Tax=Steinernema hermaphroditum TaxID=289476 RepID=A0AA39I125_9BILA|nr:hypothetical protein QR680_011527 [Steinernema hermaphroditum]